jgi:hypothetical protein
MALSRVRPASRPQKVEDLLKLIADTEVQKWLATQKAADTAPKAAAVGPTQNLSLTAFLTRLRDHISDLIAAVPTLPEELAKAVSALGNELNGRGAGTTILLFAAFVAGGFVVQWLFWQVSQPGRDWMATARLDTVRERLIAIAARLVFGASYVLAFVVGSIGAFLAFAWPFLAGEVLLGYLVAVLIYRMACVVLEFLLSPTRARTIGDAEKFRIIPMSGEAADFWTRRLSFAVGWFAFGWTTVTLLHLLGFSRPSQQLIAYALGLGLLAVGLEAVWHGTGDNRELARGFGRRTKTWLLTIFFVVLWLLWVAGMMNLFWLAATIVGLPAAMAVSQRAVNNVLRSPGTAPLCDEVPGVLATIIERGARVVLIVLAVLVLANGWGIDLIQLAANDTLATRAARGLFSAVIVLLLADFIWAGDQDDDRSQACRGARSGRAGERRRAPPVESENIAPDRAQHVDDRCCGCRCHDGPLVDRSRNRTADRRRRYRRCGRRLRRANRRQGCDQRCVLSARRCLPGGRIHPERQLHGNR